MRGNPIIRASSTDTYPGSGPATYDPHPEGIEPDVERPGAPNGRGPERKHTPPPSSPALEGLLADELADLLWRGEEPGLDQLFPSLRQRNSAQNSGIWWDQLLAEIEDLARELKGKVAQYAMIRAAQPPDGTTGTANEEAAAWIHDNLEDIAATALGMEMASREVFLRAGSTVGQDLQVSTAREQTTGRTE